MTNKELVLNVHRDMGRNDALNLAKRANSMTPTQVIEEETKVPMFVWGTDYSKCPVGSPIAQIVGGEVQIFKMITPVNTAHYPNITPNTERSLYGLCHTTNPKKAKPFVEPLGTSGLYTEGECCTENGHVWRNLYPDNAYRPSVLPERWEDLGTIEELHT